MRKIVSNFSSKLHERLKRPQYNSEMKSITSKMHTRYSIVRILHTIYAQPLTSLTKCTGDTYHLLRIKGLFQTNILAKAQSMN